MRILKNISFLYKLNGIPLEAYGHRKQLVKEAISKHDFMSTLMALLSFVMLPNEIKDNTDLNNWLGQRGGSIETASQIAQSVGKEDPKSVTSVELNKTFKRSELPTGPTNEPAAPRPDLAATKPEKGQEESYKEPHEAMPHQSYWKGRDKKYHSELNDQIIENAINLTRRVNSLLKELGINKATVNSGWRPQSYNEELRRRGVPAARKSKHITGEAVDLSDIGHTIANAVLKDPSILDKHGLWMEDPSSTRTWVHFDLGTGRNPDRFPGGSPRKNRIFRP